MISMTNIQKKIQPYFNSKLAVAVSGGSDSYALLHLLKESGHSNISVLHFNHNLREEAEEEAQWVKQKCDALNVPCHILTWDTPPTSKENILEKARDARYKAFQKVCALEKIDYVCIGHTQDDVAESFLMRLGRGSGLAGLSSMAEKGSVMGVNILRPLLDVSRKELQDYLKNKGEVWLSDPSNEKDIFLRVRVRKAKKVFEEMGLSFSHIFASSKSLRRAENALLFYTDLAWENICIDEKIYDVQKFLMYPEEIQLRLISKIIAQVTGALVLPRTTKRENMRQNILKNTDGKWTLGGVIFCLKKGELSVYSE